MLTIERYEEIKRLNRLHQNGDQHRVGVKDVPLLTALNMIGDLVVEVERLRTPAQGPGGRGHLRPVILDAKGEAVPPPPIGHQLGVERREQYAEDRFEAIMAIPDMEPWRKFSLRWGLNPPPGGWEDHEIQLVVIHKVRLGTKAVPYWEKVESARWLHKRSIKLPPGITFDGITLTGVELPE